MNKNTIFPQKITYLACHSSAIYTCKVTCLSCMLFTCLFLLPHVNYALDYILVQVVDKSHFENGAAQAVFHSPRRNAIPTSGFAPVVFWRIWALETIVNNLKSIANFGNLNVFSNINEIYLVADFWRNVSLDESGVGDRGLAAMRPACHLDTQNTVFWKFGHPKVYVRICWRWLFLENRRCISCSVVFIRHTKQYLA